MTTYAKPFICIWCKHFDRTVDAIAPVCTAFPTGIPAAIITNATDHRQPVAGDNGIQYEPDPNLEETAPFVEIFGA